MHEDVKKLLSMRVSEVLYYHWDPIGINDTPEAREEYDSYVYGIVEILTNNADIPTIAAHLSEIETTEFELKSSPGHNDRTAELLVHWHKWLSNPL